PQLHRHKLNLNDLPELVMTNLIESIRAEYLRYKALAEAAIDQLDEEQLSAEGPSGGNSIAVICWHIAGNLQSRFTDFLTSDGEKPWRQREEEFQSRTVSRAELLAKWKLGWDTLLEALAGLNDDQLKNTVTIRRQPLLVHEALHRSLAHLSYHVGQIVYLAKSLRAKDWKYLSIPPGKSDAYNQDARYDKAAAQQAKLSEMTARK
ncbi:MAG: DinB family protein, partial [Gemmatimonadaceae bacterium]